MTKKPLWTSDDVIRATGGLSNKAFEAGGVSIDSRTLQKGDIFVALKGDKMNGHSYVEAAIAAGASAAIVSKDFVPRDLSWPLVLVDDTNRALEDLGRAARARSKAKIIGVAGSVGKTSTKEMLAALFGALGKPHASKKSYNNHWGVPLTLANLPEDAAFGIFEIGMNHPGEIEKLTEQVRPHVAIITTIALEHMEFFPTGLAGVADANAEIFLGMDKDGIAILNHDNPHFARLKAAAEKQGIETIYGFGDEDCEAYLLDCQLRSDSSQVTASILGEKAAYKLKIRGKHVVSNSLGALAVVKALGGDLPTVLRVLEKFEPVAGRGNTLQVTIAKGQPPITIIDESYNANPESMQAALEAFALIEPAAGGRRIAVLGDMLELGPQGPQWHKDLANPVLKAKTDLLYCCGPLMDALYQSLPEGWRGAHEKDSKALADKLLPAVQPGDVLLIKGSNGSKMAYIIQALQNLQPPQTKDPRHAL